MHLDPGDASVLCLACDLNDTLQAKGTKETETAYGSQFCSTEGGNTGISKTTDSVSVCMHH